MYGGAGLAANGSAADGGGRTIDSCLAEAVEREPRAPYLIDDGRIWSFAEVAEVAERTSQRLARLGVEGGSRVVLWLPNGLHWIATFFAILRLGATVVPASPRLRTMDLRHVLVNSGSQVLVYGPGSLGIDFDHLVSPLLGGRDSGELGDLEHVLSVGRRSGLAGVRDLDTLPTGDVHRRAGNPSAPAVVCYTSGTTGRPKGCVHSHAALVGNGTVAARLTGLGPGERVACPVPFAHVFGFHMAVLQCALSGAALINVEPYTARRLIELATRSRATVLYCVPTIAREAAIERTARGERLTFRVALVAGAPVSEGLRRTVRSPDGLASGLSVVYGCTEAPTISQLTPDDPEEKLLESVGRPIPGVEVRICRRDSTDEVAIGEVGEIMSRGPNQMLEYLGDPDATARKYRDGWLVTGDLGRVDSDGHLHFAGRADETFLVGGFNVYPGDVESQLAELPGVREAAVIGVPDQRLGSVPMAWMVVEDAGLDEEAILRWSKQHLASYKRPRHARVVDELPRVGAGKVARAKLTDEARRLLPSLPWMVPDES